MKNKSPASPFRFRARTTQQVAEMLDVTAAYISYLAAEYGLGFRIGGQRFFRDEDVKKIATIRKPLGRPPQNGRKTGRKVAAENIRPNAKK